ncbi:unnamed protein product [Adineta ricciae]|uniref:Uncharacterized protein n=1 Tax=Adineta ricciae TaxID=249248 RepID=A0A815A996_ADIRI|nr:unnamed protein product [Adineta ricciae]
MALNNLIMDHLLTFLDQIDVINFIEAININEEWYSLRIRICQSHFACYEDSHDIDETKLVLVSKRYSDVALPELRLFIYPCFTVDAFRKLARFYNVPLFKCFVRLLPFNTIQYCADFGLIDVISFNQTTSSGRTLNEHERKLFTHNEYFETLENRKRQTSLAIINTMDEFRHNLSVRFLANTWLSAIDFSKFIIVGGCVLNAFCNLPFPDTKEQDINLIFFSGNWENFDETVDSTVAKLKEMNQNRFTADIEIQKHIGTGSYDLILPNAIKINLKFDPAKNSSDPVSHILHKLDFDICQILYNGQSLLSTCSFIEAITTKTFIMYNLHANISKNTCIRIQKYCNRGFKLIVPFNFDGDFNELMSQELIPLYSVREFYYMEDDGEIQFATQETCPVHLPIVDTFRLQDEFIRGICPKLFDYK